MSKAQPRHVQSLVLDVVWPCKTAAQPNNETTSHNISCRDTMRFKRGLEGLSPVIRSFSGTSFSFSRMAFSCKQEMHLCALASGIKLRVPLPALFGSFHPALACALPQRITTQPDTDEGHPSLTCFFSLACFLGSLQGLVRLPIGLGISDECVCSLQEYPSAKPRTKILQHANPPHKPRQIRQLVHNAPNVPASNCDLSICSLCDSSIFCGLSCRGIGTCGIFGTHLINEPRS